MSDLGSAFWLSIRVAVAATFFTALVAVPLAFGMSRRRGFRGRSMVEAVILMPLVLPPTVIGYLVIAAMGARGWLGRPLFEAFGYTILFRFEGAVLAAAIVALPMMYMPAKAAFAAVEPELEDIARLHGASGLRLFWHVSVPLARRGLISGLVLTFARALGEFGATIMVFGWQPDRVTLPISVYAHFEQGDMGGAVPAVVALTLLSFGLVVFFNTVGGLGGRPDPR